MPHLVVSRRDVCVCGSHGAAALPLPEGASRFLFKWRPVWRAVRRGRNNKVLSPSLRCPVVSWRDIYVCGSKARRHFPCLVTPLCSYLYGGLYGGLYGSADIIRYFPRLSVCDSHGAAAPWPRCEARRGTAGRRGAPVIMLMKERKSGRTCSSASCSTVWKRVG